MIRPHWTREVVFALKALLVAGVGAVAIWYATDRGFLRLTEEQFFQCVIGLVALAGILMLYMRQFCEQSRAYITDRRFVRFEGAIPAWQSQRALFWSDVVKTRAFSPSVFLKMLNVGSLELIPNFGPEGQNILVRYAFMFGDLGAYLDKVVYTFKNQPAEMKNLRDFVAKPKGKRY